jgi:hypothetical protein
MCDLCHHNIHFLEPILHLKFTIKTSRTHMYACTYTHIYTCMDIIACAIFVITTSIFLGHFFVSSLLQIFSAHVPPSKKEISKEPLKVCMYVCVCVCKCLEQNLEKASLSCQIRLYAVEYMLYVGMYIIHI